MKELCTWLISASESQLCLWFLKLDATECLLHELSGIIEAAVEMCVVVLMVLIPVRECGWSSEVHVLSGIHGDGGLDPGC